MRPPVTLPETAFKTSEGKQNSDKLTSCYRSSCLFSASLTANTGPTCSEIQLRAEHHVQAMRSGERRCRTQTRRQLHPLQPPTPQLSTPTSRPFVCLIDLPFKRVSCSIAAVWTFWFICGHRGCTWTPTHTHPKKGGGKKSIISPLCLSGGRLQREVTGARVHFSASG